MTKEILLQNFGFTHGILNKNVEGVSHEESLRPATENASCINWLVGHVLRSRNGAHALVGLSPAIDEQEVARYKQGAEPIDGPGEGVVALEKLVAAFNASQDVLSARLEKMTEEELSAACSHVLQPGQQSKVGVQLALLNFHESYHVGQTGILRRLAGKQSQLSNPS